MGTCISWVFNFTTLAEPKNQRQAHLKHYLNFTSFQFINPFALWNFMAKTCFKATQTIFWSLSVYKEVKHTRKLCMGCNFRSKCKISASKVQVWTKFRGSFWVFKLHVQQSNNFELFHFPSTPYVQQMVRS